MRQLGRGTIDPFAAVVSVLEHVQIITTEGIKDSVGAEAGITIVAAMVDMASTIAISLDPWEVITTITWAFKGTWA